MVYRFDPESMGSPVEYESIADGYIYHDHKLNMISLQDRGMLYSYVLDHADSRTAVISYDEGFDKDQRVILVESTNYLGHDGLDLVISNDESYLLMPTALDFGHFLLVRLDGSTIAETVALDESSPHYSMAGYIAEYAFDSENSLWLGNGRHAVRFFDSEFEDTFFELVYPEEYQSIDTVRLEQAVEGTLYLTYTVARNPYYRENIMALSLADEQFSFVFPDEFYQGIEGAFHFTDYSVTDENKLYFSCYQEGPIESGVVDLSTSVVHTIVGHVESFYDE
jgi:hypothetical protein